MPQNVYDFECLSVNGDRVSLSQYRGKVALVVNTATFCGFTPQFMGLNHLYRHYRERGFVVLAFPCNQFGYQDPLSSERINDFCTRNYGATFPMFAKVKVNGRDADPLFEFLKASAPGLFGSTFIKWNFTKFLIDREGNVVRRFGSAAFPSRLSYHIEPLLA